MEDILRVLVKVQCHKLEILLQKPPLTFISKGALDRISRSRAVIQGYGLYS